MLMIPARPPILAPEAVHAAAEGAARAIPPLWPLSSSVAVNPFLGQTGEPLPKAAARLRRAGGIALTMPRSYYAERLRSGEITDLDLAAALDAATTSIGLAALKQAAQAPRPAPRAAPTVADLAAEASGIDWPGLIGERLGHWAAAYFDQGQALWAMPRADGGAYAAWRMVATHDLTPEIAGLTSFAATVAQAPGSAADAISLAVEQLGLGEDGLKTYLHRLLVSLGGWAQVARYRLWQAELAGQSDATVTDLLAIRLIWEAALLSQYRSRIEGPWEAAIAAYEEPVALTADDEIDAILQEAFERAAQRRLQFLLSDATCAPKAERPALQMAFCIDVRSEVFRRALESISPDIVTLGFAGFFGLGVAHRPFASDVAEARLPVLLNPGAVTRAGGRDEQTDQTARIAARARRAWGRFKLAAVSSFAFVEAAGPLYAGKLLRDGLGVAKKAPPHDPAPRFDPPLDLATRIGMAATVLKAMSLTTGFARLVLLAGHGANVVNNPHASALHCGACGGYPGEVNARLLAALLNDPQVRQGLLAHAIAIPADTLFLAALHDTTTDEVTLYHADHHSPPHDPDIAQAKSWLAAAAILARSERALRLPHASRGTAVVRRASDWAEVRPEWALAGCQAFIAAPRRRTAALNLGGRAFLHDYDWRQDDGFGVLELILTAPVVVASWISLQYYGSTVAPELFGAGNKLLHNVTGGIGVVEGNGGLLRAGLPWQSVHDGDRLVHEPLRLSVLVEAPREAIGAILERHPQVRALFDNKWLHLFALDDQGRMAWRYAGDLRWQEAAAEPLADHSHSIVPGGLEV
jgi:hypothetical protein